MGYLLGSCTGQWFEHRPPAFVADLPTDIHHVRRRWRVVLSQQYAIPATVRCARMRALVAILLTAYAAEAMWFWPNYLAYFNVIAGGPRHAYRWFVDSSLDWGQDLKVLKPRLDNYPDEAGAGLPVYLSYFGVARPDYYQIHAQLLPGKGLPAPSRLPQTLGPGLYCVSATMLEQVYSRPRGRWNATYEELYQQGRTLLTR